MSKTRKAKKDNVTRIQRGVGFSHGLNKGLSVVQRTVAKLTRVNKDAVKLSVTLVGPLIEKPTELAGETAEFVMRPQDAYDFFKSAGECFGAIFEEGEAVSKPKIQIVGADSLPIKKEG